MTGDRFEFIRRIKNLRRVFSCLIWDRRGNIGALTALLILPMAGSIALATEASGWYMVNRVAQNAADSAALAAASNNDNPGTGYINEGKAVAAKYGFTDGSNHATVAVTYTTTDVPACSVGCYKAVVTQAVPLFFANIVGYAGNTNYSGVRGQSIQAGALAIAKTALVDDCITSLGGDKNSILFDGSPDGDLTGCVLKSNGGMACNGHDDNFRFIVYGGADKKCDPSQNGASFTDPYAGVYNANVPVNNCASYPGQTINAIPAIPVCGNATLGGNIQVSGNQVLVIENGALNLGSHTLSTLAGAGLTIVFSGTNNVSNFITGSNSSVLDIAAPTSGSWSGVAIYQDTKGSAVSLTLDGNSPTLKVTGLFYVPNTDLIVKGAINHASNGVNCFTLVDNSVNIKGTGSIFQYPTSQCPQAGLNIVPQSLLIAGAQLVY